MSILTITITSNNKIIILSEKPSIITKYLKGLESDLKQDIVNACQCVIDSKDMEERASLLPLIRANNTLGRVQEINRLHKKIINGCTLTLKSLLGSYDFMYRGSAYFIKYEIN